MVSLVVTERPQLTALRAAWLFDGGGRSLVPHPWVVLDGGTVVSVRTGGAAPDGARLVDLGAATILPGLVDTHVHLAFDSSRDPVGALAGRTDDETVAAMRRAARTALRGGVTTVRDLGDRGYLSLRLRGAADLPTLLTAGPPVTTPGGHCHYLGGAVGEGVGGIREAVREHAERGVDVIKVMASGGTLTPGTRQEEAQFSAVELRAAVEEAHRLGLPVTAHTHATAAIRAAVDAGVDGMEHVSFWSADGVDEPGDLVETIVKQGIALGATVGIVPVPGAIPPAAVLQRMPRIIGNFRRFVAAGALVVAGSDAGIGPVKPPDVVRTALPQLVELGMDRAEALRTVTSVGARVVGLGDRKGRVAPGYDADLLVVDGDPLTDPDAIHRIVAVYRAGLPVDRS